MKPTISVIIPVYNGEKTLRQCLNSVLNQTYNNYEVIVVDNNSTDNTKEIIKEFQRKSEKIRHFFEKKKGRGAARNTGIKHAKEAIITMTDSDCIVPKNWLQELTKPIRKGNESAVVGSEKEFISNYWTNHIQKANSEFVKRTLNGRYISHIDTKNFAIKSSIIKKLIFDSNLKALEDFEFYLRLKKIAKIRFLPSIVVNHCHPSSFRKLVKTNFERGYFAKKIFDKHKKNINFKNEPMVESLSIKNFLLFFPWIFLQFFKRPVGEAYFILVSEVSWRVGLLWSIIK